MGVTDCIYTMGGDGGSRRIHSLSRSKQGHIYIGIASTKKPSGTGEARRRGRGFSTPYRSRCAMSDSLGLVLASRLIECELSQCASTAIKNNMC